MPKITANVLTDRTIKAAKPKEKDYKLTDGGGLFLLITKNGGKRWRFKYRFDNKEKIYAIGIYPDVSLSDARIIKNDLRSKVAGGVSPTDEKRKAKEEQQKQDDTKMIKKLFTFEKLAGDILEEWLQNGSIGDAHYKRTKLYFVNDAYPIIGDIPIGEITPHNIKSVIERVNKRGRNESARKLFYALSKVFRIFVTRNNPNESSRNYRIDINPCLSIDITDLIGKPTGRHYPTITDDKGIKALLLAIDDYKGDFVTKQALRLMPYTALRSHNIRFAEWSEIDFNEKRWNIPGDKMKTKQDFTIPLTSSMITILEDTKVLTGEDRYIFPSFRDKSRPMSDNTLLGAIRRLGYTKDEFVPHGFRAMFSTVLREKTDFKDELIEFSLAHSIGSKVSQSYNRSKYMDQRRELMQWWSDFLDDTKKIKG